METGPTMFDWDILVAAVLTVPVIEPGAPRGGKNRTIQSYARRTQAARWCSANHEPRETAN